MRLQAGCRPRLLDEAQRRRGIGHEVAWEVAWVEHLHQQRHAVRLGPLGRPTQPLRNGQGFGLRAGPRQRVRLGVARVASCLNSAPQP